VEVIHRTVHSVLRFKTLCSHSPLAGRPFVHPHPTDDYLFGIYVLRPFLSAAAAFSGDFAGRCKAESSL
jgi:hypothetical protein